MDNGVDDEGDSATEYDGDNGDGLADNDVDEDGVGDGATNDDGNGDDDGATDDDDDDGNDSNGAAVDDNDVDNDDKDVDDDDKDVDDDDKDVDDVNVDNLPPRVGKRNDGCDETKTEEEETVADSVACGDTHNNQPDHGEGGW